MPKHVRRWPLTDSDELRKLASDWEYYQRLPDIEWRHEMQRAVVVELMVVVSRLKARCELEPPPPKPVRRFHILFGPKRRGT